MNKESDKNNETIIENLENIKQLEIIIENMKKDLQAKDKDIMVKIKEIDILKREVQVKDAEIGEKEAIIKNLEDEDSFSQDSDNEEEEQTKKHCHNELSGKETRDNGSESEGKYELFQLEVVSDKEVYVCNFCDEGLDSEAEVREHLKSKHKKELKFD